MVNMENKNNTPYNLSATFKNSDVEAMLSKLTGVSRIGAGAEASCVTCQGNATSFRDSLSKKEYTISGMCQVCQDAVFGVSDE